MKTPKTKKVEPEQKDIDNYVRNFSKVGAILDNLPQVKKCDCQKDINGIGWHICQQNEQVR